MNFVEEMTAIQSCPTKYVLAVNDTLNVISGKWKIPIIAALLQGQKRFKDFEQNIDKITPRMLSKELKELELNGIVNRMVKSTSPIRIEYELTPSGEDLRNVINVMIEWGIQHRYTTVGG